MKLLIIILLSFFNVSNGQTMNSNKKNKEIKYLALGDSYTIGEKVEVPQRYPVQLAESLRKEGYKISDPLIIAKTGWTTDELLDGIKKENPDSVYDFVTLLIGVNNQYRGRSSKEYRAQFVVLLDKAIEFAGNHPEHVIVISIPDWGVTPFAEGRNRKKIGKEIDLFNDISKAESLDRRVLYVDITGISRKAANDGTLVAKDGLHPSGKMYGLWVKKIAPIVKKIITK